MPEHSSNPPVPSSVQARLQEVAELLRQAHHLEPEAQAQLSDLIEELSQTLDPAGAQSAETTHLAQSAAHLAQALHQQHDPGLLDAARKRLEEATLRAESKAPLATDIVRRLLDTLANLGI